MVPLIFQYVVDSKPGLWKCWHISALYRFSTGLEYQIELQKLLVLVQNGIWTNGAHLGLGSYLVTDRLKTSRKWSNMQLFATFSHYNHLKLFCLRHFSSSEPFLDGVISTYEEHEDSVYAAEWSTADPWLFASLSYDGRLVINRVPRATKYKILL